MGARPRHAIAASLLVPALLLAAPTSAGAQGVTLSSASGAGGGPVLVEKSAVVAKATSAFSAASARLVDAGPGDLPAQTRARLERVAASIVDEFDAAVRERVEALEGDGVLTAKETSEALASLRERYLYELRQAVDATRRDHAPPPVAREFDGSSDYVRALFAYTLFERNAPRDWLYLFGLLLAGIATAWLGNAVLGGLADRLMRRGHAWQAELLRSLSGPVYLTAIVLGVYTGLNWIWLPGIAHLPLRRLMYVTLVTALFWFLWNASWALASGVAWFIRSSYTRTISHHARVVISRLLKVVLVIAYTLILINVILQSDLTGLLAGLGIAGLALSFVLRGTIENVTASFTIFGDKPFRVGDLIQYRDQWGHIEDIGFRSTRFRTFDGHLVNIPNAVLVQEAMQNVGERPHIRRRFRIGLTYDTPPEKVREAVAILREILEDHRGQPPDHPPHVVFEGYGAYDLQLLVQYYYAPPDYWEALEFDTEVNLRILERFNRAGIDFAFPTQTARLASEPGQVFRVRPENGAGPDGDAPDAGTAERGESA